MHLQKFKIKSAGKTDIGRVRATNQDSFLIDEPHGIFIVADGMGGHAGGEIASRICVENVAEQICAHSEIFSLKIPKKHPDPNISLALSDAINFASSRIYEHSLEDPSLRGMGTTATAIKIVGEQAYYAHVGDSRLYLVRKNFIYQITYDHSLVNEQVRAGILTREEAEVHHLKNVITRSVGYQEEEDVDTSSFTLEKGDYLVLCSDGLHGKMDDEELSQLISTWGLAAVNILVDTANSRGGEDNITALIVEVN